MSGDWLIEEGMYGPRIVVTGPWSEATLEALVSSGARELELNYAKGWTGSDIAFIRELPQLEALNVTHLTLKDIRPVNALHSLRYLKISTYCKTELDFASWPSLEECALDAWRPRAKSIIEHRGIKKLFINKWNQGKDLTDFSRMAQLESLQLYSPSRLESLAGVESLTRLTRFELALAGRLSSLEGVENLIELRHFRLSTCRKVNDISPVASLRRLKELFVLNCGDVETIRPIAGLVDLEKFLFETTNVLDGDLSPLQFLPKLKAVAFRERPHYSLTRDDLPHV